MERQWSDRTSRSNPALSAAEVGEQDERLPWMRSNTPELMVSFRFTNGDWKVFPYHDLTGFDFMGNELIKLYFFHATVVIQGTNLIELADLLRRQQVMEVREQNEFTLLPGSPCVRKVSIIEANLAAVARKPAA